MIEEFEAPGKEGKIVLGPGGEALFSENVPFNSPSAASAVILGRKDNGRKSWKMKGTKKTYHNWEIEQIEAARNIWDQH